MTTKHSGEVNELTVFVAHCKCGWISESMDTAADAQELLDTHAKTERAVARVAQEQPVVQVRKPTKIRLREACKRENAPHYNTVLRAAQDGKIELFQFAGKGPLYVDEADLEALMQPVAHVVPATGAPHSLDAVPRRRRCTECNRVSIDGTYCARHKAAANNESQEN